MLYAAVVTLAHVYNYTHGACYSSQLELEVTYIGYVVHAILIMGVTYGSFWFLMRKLNEGLRGVLLHTGLALPQVYAPVLIPKGTPSANSIIESNLPIYYILLMWQYIYGRERERNQDSKSYLDSKSSRKLRMNVRETSDI